MIRIPIIYNKNNPYIGKVVSTKRIVGPKADDETVHIIIDHEGDFPFIEGQALGVIPPGTDDNGELYHIRYYSIASTSLGDDMAEQTVSLVLQRATHWDPEP